MGCLVRVGAACRLLICLFDFMLVWVLVDCCRWLICGLFTAVDLTFVLLLCRFAVWLVASDGLWRVWVLSWCFAYVCGLVL